MHVALAEQIKPLLEQLVFHASELQGLSCCQEQLQPIGLQRHAAELCLAESERALTAAVRAMRVCCEAACSYRNLFSWLQRCQKRQVAMSVAAVVKRL